MFSTWYQSSQVLPSCAQLLKSVAPILLYFCPAATLSSAQALFSGHSTSYHLHARALLSLNRNLAAPLQLQFVLLLLLHNLCPVIFLQICATILLWPLLSAPPFSCCCVFMELLSISGRVLLFSQFVLLQPSSPRRLSSVHGSSYSASKCGAIPHDSSSSARGFQASAPHHSTSACRQFWASFAPGSANFKHSWFTPLDRLSKIWF